MEIGRISGSTRVLGREQGYCRLPIRDERISDPVNGDGTPMMTSAWIPLPHEVEAIMRGAPIHVSILGVQHPPIRVYVGEPPAVS